MESELLRWTLPFLERYETAVELDKFDYSNFYVYRACSVMYKEQIVFFGGYQHPTRVVKLNGCALEDVPVQLPVNMEVIWPVFHEVFPTYARWKTFFYFSTTRAWPLWDKFGCVGQNSRPRTV